MGAGERKNIKFDYYYGRESLTFSFYRIPKALFTEPYFQGLSTDAKLLYGIMLDRMSLFACLCLLRTDGLMIREELISS